MGVPGQGVANGLREMATRTGMGDPPRTACTP